MTARAARRSTATSRSLEAARYMPRTRMCFLAFTDGGAHVGSICDGSFPTFLITHWTRDRTRGPKLPLADIIRLQARGQAAPMSVAAE